MLMERVAPFRTGLGIAKSVELEDRALDTEFFQELVGEAEQLDIGLRLASADDLRVELVEFAEAPLLWPLIAEGRTEGRDLERRELLPTSLRLARPVPGVDLGRGRDGFPPRP